VQTVNARDLHAFLEVASRYNDWISNRIKQFNFEEGRDFVALTKNLVGGGVEKEHFLTLDMAKELSMVERNAKGKEARQYFIGLAGAPRRAAGEGYCLLALRVARRIDQVKCRAFAATMQEFTAWQP
jgi:phage anti-repressor protein